MQIGKEIKARREKMGLTQKELGELVGKTPQRISDIEQDRKEPVASTLAPILRSLKGELKIIWHPFQE